MYGVAFVIYFLIQLCRTPRKLDLDRDAREIELNHVIFKSEETVKQREADLRALKENPLRSAAEQHEYDTVKGVLKVTGDKGIKALRHIRKHGSLTFGTFSPVLAPGLNAQEMQWVYNHAASEGVLTVGGKQELGERIYSISPKMEKALDEALYE
jgi:hypothetical protein